MPTKKSPRTPLDIFREVFTEVSVPKGGLPMMPTRIADVASDDLGNMIARYTAWREFTEDRHAQACAVYAQCKSDYDLAYSTEFLSLSNMTVTEKKTAVNANQKVADLYKQLTDAEIYKDLLANKLDSFSNVLAMLSRELTRRGVQNSGV